MAALLEVPYSTLVHWIYPTNKPGRYRQFTIPKRNGDPRVIMAPTKSLGILQAKLNSVLAKVYQPKPSVHGFVPQKSIVSNARQHCGQRLILNVDLKDFFPTINFGRVRGMFIAKPYGLPKAVATVLAQICCHENQLPQGAPTSPAVSNMVCSRLDTQLQRLAQHYQCFYTRYADDITLSTFRSEFSADICTKVDDVVRLGDDLVNLITSNGFEINARKVHLQNQYSHQEVTGLTVNLKPNVRRSYIREIRAMLHAWQKFGLELASRHHFPHRHGRLPGVGDALPPYKDILRGKIAFLAMVRGKDELFRKFTLQLDRLAGSVDPLTEEALRPKPLRDRIRDALWVLECDACILQGTAFALHGYGLITCHHVFVNGDNALCEHMKIFRPQSGAKKYPVSLASFSKEIDLAVLESKAPIGGELVITSRADTLEDDVDVIVGGFPNYWYSDNGYVVGGRVVGHRTVSQIRRALVSAPIVGGVSGGPVVDAGGFVIGVAVTGADSMAKVLETEKHGVIPIEALKLLFPVTKAAPPEAPMAASIVRPPPERESPVRPPPEPESSAPLLPEPERSAPPPPERKSSAPPPPIA